MPSELNAGLGFLSLTTAQQESFRPSPVPVLARFEAGDCVYKWTSYPLVKPKTGRITEYWSPWNRFKTGSLEIPGFKELRTRYGNVAGGVGRPQDFARSRNAVTEQWNRMDALLKAQFLKPVWGYVGKTAAQRKFDDPAHPSEQNNVFFIGGDYQLLVPNLTEQWIKKL
ncbi:hypothetical protein DYQ86_03215 [Acidobacteria bacterium AB60]|nr:hypothetical protein DYQ86_03215 [Acidobacteria bacterium AB60]